MAAIYTTIILLTLGLCEGSIKICPEVSVNSTHSAFGTSSYVQRGVWHQVPCPSFRPNEAISRVIWYKQESPATPEQTLITHKRNADYPESDRYAFGMSGFSLVIKGVEESDGGSYMCQVIPRDTTERNGEVDIQVIGVTFPRSSSQASSTASFQRGRRQTLPCKCKSHTPDVVYWSKGEGVTTGTQIIGARFSDGATLHIQQGADYSIEGDASLTFNSLNDVQDAQRFWCHVFQSDGTLRNCDTNVQLSDEVESASDALKAIERSFYLRNDTQQILPCLSWTPGDTACEVEWTKLDNPNRQVLSYNLSTGVVDSNPEFDLASEFGLVIQSVDNVHAGVYRCAVGGENQIDVEVRVIGDHFPLDDGIATEGDSVTFNPKTRFSVQCPALSDISLTRKATLFWSFGATDEESTTMIGTLNLPDGPIKMADLGKNCLGISMEGALLLNNCSQDGDVRYWCVVFQANDDLIRSYVNVLINDSNGDQESPNVVTIIVCVPLFVVVFLGIVFFLMRKRRRRYSHYREHNERGDYKRHKKEPAKHFRKLAKKIKPFVIRKMGRIPITPWVARDDVCFAPTDTVYKPLEMVANVSHRGNTVQYQLDSESFIFDDGIPELASRHVLIQGRKGCGKTTFLYRLIYDWAMERERALWGSDQIVVLVPAWLLIKAKTIGEAVVECMLPKDANISAESINAHYARDKSNLTILVDDCNDKNDMDAVMKVMTDNEFLGCHLVLTTRGEELAKAASRKYNMRHVTITGFTLRNAIKYINAVLDTAEDRKKATPEHKAVKSKAKPKSGSTADTNIQQHLPKTEESPTVLAPPETQEATATDTFLKKTEQPKTQTKNKKRNLHQYLEEDILQPDVSCLPAVLVALCQMSIWTEGDAFKTNATMANLFFRLVKCMFDRMKGLKVGVTEGKQLRLLPEDQLNVLAELGSVAYSRLVDSCANYADYSKEDFLSSSEKREHALEVAKEVGLLRPLLVESTVESTEHNVEVAFSEVSEVDIRRGFLCCKRKQQRGTEPYSMMQDTELTSLTSPTNERFCFVLEILEQLCVAVFLAQATGKVKTWLEKISNICQREITERFSDVLQFAIQDNQFDREALVDYCAEIINRENNQVRPLHVVLQLQKFVELCLQLNFEGQCAGALNKKLKSIFADGRVRLIGISSYKLRLLSYLLQHAQPKDKSRLNVKSVELLSIGNYDWSELQEYIGYFSSGENGLEKKTQVKTKAEDSPPAATGIHQGTVPGSRKDIKKFPEHQQSVSHPPVSKEVNSAQQEVKATNCEPQPTLEKEPIFNAGQTTATDLLIGVDKLSGYRTSQSDQSQSKTQQSSVSHQRMDTNEEKAVTTFPGTDMKNEPQFKTVDTGIASTSELQIGHGNALETKYQTYRPKPHSPVNEENQPLPDPRGSENNVDDISLPTQSEPKVSVSPIEDESIVSPIDDVITSYDVIDNKKELADVLKKLRERLQSKTKDMPWFPFDESDISVLQTVQSYGLQELLKSQAGECFSSGSAIDLVRCLLRLEMLESLVLVGTILSSDAISDFAKNAHNLPSLKKLDLRLNKQFNDRAFVAVTNLLLRQCRKLTDLRLSLYRVTIKGFDLVLTEMKKDGAASWRRLKTLYLLHGSPAERFVGFLSNSLSYFHSVECFHLSATFNGEEIPDDIQVEFNQNMTNPKIMPHLEDLDIGNMETLKARLASLKLPKKEKGSVISNLFGTTVTDPGKRQQARLQSQ